jgi:integrase
MDKLPYIKFERGYTYFRRGDAPRVRIFAEPGSADFYAEYAACIAASNPLATDAQGTWRWLASQYYEWHGFAGLAKSTQISRRNVLEQFVPVISRKHVSAFTAYDVIALLDEKANSGAPEAAHTRLKALRHLLDFGVSRGHIKENVARDPAVVIANRAIKGRTGGHRTWTAKEINRYFDAYRLGTPEHLRMCVFLYTGARVSDAAMLGPVHERNGVLTWTETKDKERLGKTTSVPILPPLRAAIDATRTGDLVYIVGDQGRPYGVKSLSQRFVKDARAVGLDKGLSPHGVRKAGATFAANAGASTYELMAMYGWTTTKQAEIYTRDVDRPRLAARAAELIGVETSTKKEQSGEP